MLTLRQTHICVHAHSHLRVLPPARPPLGCRAGFMPVILIGWCHAGHMEGSTTVYTEQRSVWCLSPSPPSLLPHRLLKLPLVLSPEFPAWPKPWFCFLSCSSGKWALDLHGLGLCQALFSFTLTVTSQAFDPLLPSLPPTLLTLRFPFTT